MSVGYQSEIGNDLIDLMNNEMFSEAVTVVNKSGALLSRRYSAIPNTKSSYMQAEREYIFYGAMTFLNEDEATSLRGCYFTRNRYPDRTYILMSVIPEPTDSRLATVFAVQTNVTLSIAKVVKTKSQTTGNEVLTAQAIYSNVKAYKTATVQRQQQTSDGNVDRTIITITLPSTVTISEENVVVMKGYVFNSATGQNEYKDIRYRVDSIDTSMLEYKSSVVYGAITCQLSIDLRGAEA